MENKIGIVILNYLNFEDTIECVQSIMDQSFQNFKAVIVDNASNNDSFSKINLIIEDIENVDLIQSPVNLGYAKGNNLGINYLINNYNVDDIIILNNDVVFFDKQFIEKLSEIKFSNEIGAIGTRITGMDGLNQNPAKFDYSKDMIKKKIYNYENNIHTPITYKSYLNKSKMMMYLKKIYKKQKYKCDRKTRILEHNELLHGSVILLTRNYLNVFKGFYPKTFLYGEEMILKIIFNKYKLEMLYVPELNIFHKEDQSSAMSFNNDNSIMQKYYFESNKIILDIYDKNIEEIKNDFIK